MIQIVKITLLFLSCLCSHISLASKVEGEVVKLRVTSLEEFDQLPVDALRKSADLREISKDFLVDGRILQKFPNLVTANVLGDDDGTMVKTLTHLKHLTSLVLTMCHISEGVIGVLRSFGNLQHITFKSCEFTAWPQLSNLKSLKCLESIVISSCILLQVVDPVMHLREFTLPSLSQVISMEYCPSLRLLRLSDAYGKDEQKLEFNKRHPEIKLVIECLDKSNAY